MFPPSRLPVVSSISNQGLALSASRSLFARCTIGASPSISARAAVKSSRARALSPRLARNSAKSAAAFETAYNQALPKLESAPLDRLREVNAILFRTERAMTLPQGLPNRDWFKHRIYAPGTYTGYSVKTLPGLREAIEGNRIEEAGQQMQQVGDVLRSLDSQVQEATRILAGM